METNVGTTDASGGNSDAAELLAVKEFKIVLNRCELVCYTNVDEWIYVGIATEFIPGLEGTRADWVSQVVFVSWEVFD